MHDLNCPFCGNPAVKIIRFDGVLHCNRHGNFEWIDRGRLRDVDLISIYQGYKYNATIDIDYKRMRPLYIQGFRKRILKYFDKIEHLSLLDVGCANGEYLDCGKELGMSRLVGVEIDEKAVGKAQEFGTIHKRLKELDERFDIVQCKNLLSNIENFHDNFSNLLNFLKPDGVLFIDVLNQFGMIARMKKIFGNPGYLRPPFVINGFSKQAVRAMVEYHGAELLKLSTVYCGSQMLPYRKTLALTIRGRFSQFFGGASMITADIKL